MTGHERRPLAASHSQLFGSPHDAFTQRKLACLVHLERQPEDECWSQPRAPLVSHWAAVWIQHFNIQDRKQGVRCSRFSASHPCGIIGHRGVAARI